MHKIITLLLLLSTGLTIQAQNQLEAILQKGENATKHNIYIDLKDDRGNQCTIPISIIKGKKEGAVFTLTSGIHGFEYPPIIANQELIQEIDPALLSGTLIILPLANPPSFYSRTPFLNPQDSLNLNRVFPGSPTGSITQRIAHYLTHSVIAQSDVFIDIHGGDANEDLLPFICYYNNESNAQQTRRAQQLSEASGFEHIVSYDYTLRDDQAAKYAFKQAVQDGKVALSIECGKLGNLQKDAVALIKKGVYNMLQIMGMYPKTQEAKTDFLRITQQVYIRSKHRGVFQSDYVAGDRVKEGETVGWIKDEFGATITEIKATHSGIILYKIGTPPLNVGETIMCIGY
ncbi:MAG: M14 family metallopeptidase [Bacteroidota bacterium]